MGLTVEKVEKRHLNLTKTMIMIVLGWWFHIFLIKTPYLGEDEPILTHIYSDGLGWVNHHQLTRSLASSRILAPTPSSIV